MKRTSLNQIGSGLVVVLAILVVVAVVAVVGLKVVNRQTATTLSPATTASKTVPAKINNTADLEKASQALNSSDDGSADLSQLDNDLNSLL